MKRWWIIAAVAAVAVLAFFGFRAYSQAQLDQAMADLQTEIVRKGPLTAKIGRAHV